MQFSGKVIRKTVSPGSKSERDAVVLSGDHGELTLRLRDSNPLENGALEGLVGQEIQVEGVQVGPALIVDSYRVKDPE